MENPILDAFAICGHEWSQFQHWFRWEPDVLLEEVEIMKTLVPCGVCRRLVDEEGWIVHAQENHCGGRRISMDQLRIYRLVSGTKCVICNFTYLNDDEKNDHISLHLNASSGQGRRFPLQVGMGIGNLSVYERTLKLRTFLYYNFLRNHDYYLYLLLPTWLQGETVKEKLRNINKLTYIPVTISNSYNTIFNPFLLSKYDLYKTLVYAPAMDENFDGLNSYRRMYGKLMLQLLASINQVPDAMRFVRFVLVKNPKWNQFVEDNLIHVTDADITEVMRDVLENHRTVICSHDLYDADGCRDLRCSCFIHFGVNFCLHTAASDPANDYISMKRLFDSRFGLGKFELVVNPLPSMWMEFAEEVITKRRIEAHRPTPYYVYTVICTEDRNSAELPLQTNEEDDLEREKLSLYVGLSYVRGVPAYHYKDLEEEDNEDDNDQVEQELKGSELSKCIQQGKKALFMLRNPLLESYQRAQNLEACLQLYGVLMKEFNIDSPVKFINKRLELFGLWSVSNEDLENIIRLVDQEVSLFYRNGNDGLQQHNWGIFERPFLLNEAVALPVL